MLEKFMPNCKLLSNGAQGGMGETGKHTKFGKQWSNFCGKHLHIFLGNPHLGHNLGLGGLGHGSLQSSNGGLGRSQSGGLWHGC